MPMSYSLDLRQRVVKAYESKEGSIRQLAERFQVHFTTVRNWLKLYRETQSLSPKQGKSGRRSVIQGEHKEFLENLYRQHPDMPHAQACERFFERFGKRLRPWSMSRAHKRLGMSRKKNFL